MRTKRIVSDSVIYLGSSSLAAGIPFLLLPLLSRYLTPADFGDVGIFQGLYTFFLAISGLGVAGAVVRQSYDTENKGIAVYIFNALLILAATTTVYAVALYCTSGLLAESLDIPSEFFFPALMAASMVFVLNILLGQFQVQQRPLYYGLFQITHSFLNVSLSIAGVIVLSAGAFGRVGGIVLAAIVFGIIALFVLKAIERIKIQINVPNIKSALRFGVPILPHELGTFMLNWISIFAVNSILNKHAAGLYFIAFQISMIIGVFCDAFNKAYVPWLFSILSKNEKEGRLSAVKLTYLYMAVLSLLVLLAFTVAPWFVRFAFEERYASAAWIVGWLILGQALGGCYLMVTNYVLYSRRTEIMSAITVVANMVNLALLFWLVPIMGLQGAIIGFVVTRAIIFVLTWGCAAKLVPMPWLLTSAR